MEKRILLAFSLSLLVLLAFQRLYAPRPSQKPQSPPVVVTQKPSAKPEPVNPIASLTPSDIRASRVEDIDVDNPLYSAVMANAGGLLKSFKLKAYKDAKGQPIELINQDALAKVGAPLALSTGDEEIDQAISRAHFAVRREGTQIRLEFAGAGLHVQKTIEFESDTYRLKLASKVVRNGRPLPHAIVWQGRFGDQSIEPNASMSNVVYQEAASYERINVASIKEPREIPGTPTHLGIEDQYFLAMFVLPAGASRTVVRTKEISGENEKPVAAIALTVPVPDANGIRLYVGPKHEDWLRKADPTLAAVVDYGVFEFITRPLLYALMWLNHYIGNYGWSIIVLTIIINFVLFPLRLKQQVSMQKMQQIQPQMKTLQDKYKKLKASDPRRQPVQAEMMALYKRHGVNPMGGCLPLLLQMPFLFAFWNMLSVSIEMRQAPWILWIRDLSQYDPYYITPILMAVSMIIMQKMTPTAMDPTQAKIMMVMPVMLTFMFLWVQSGLMLYWLTSNTVGIGQQVFINKYWAPRTEDPLRSRRPRSRRTEKAD